MQKSLRRKHRPLDELCYFADNDAKSSLSVQDYISSACLDKHVPASGLGAFMCVLEHPEAPESSGSGALQGLTTRVAPI